MSQQATALARANETRLGAARQRRELARQPARVVVPALVHPSRELGTYKLKSLFCANSGLRKSLVRGVGPSRLESLFRQLEKDRPLGRRWHQDLRLGDLTVKERRLFVKALFRVTQEVG